MIIAIDGPAASGKGTLGKRLATITAFATRHRRDLSRRGEGMLDGAMISPTKRRR